MPAFITLTEYRVVSAKGTRDDRPVVVNAAHIIKMARDGPRTFLLLAPGVSVQVTETPQEIQASLAEAALEPLRN